MHVPPLRDQIDLLRKLFWVLGVPLLGVFVGIGLLARQTTHTVADFTRDVTALADLPFYAGALSTLGLLLWSATAAICFLTHSLLRSGTDAPLAQYIGFGGGLTLLLLLDDAYLLHEEVFPKYLGVPQLLVVVAYPVLGLLFAWTYRYVLARTYYLLFLLSLVAFAVSIGADFVMYRFVPETGVLMLMEDGGKLIGIVGWTVYFGHTCRVALVKQLREGEEPRFASGDGIPGRESIVVPTVSKE